MPRRLGRDWGRRAFGSDPTLYDRARPSYPAGLFALLRTRCGLRPGFRAFEVGAGTGLATRSMLDLGASSLVVVEPDRRLARYLVGALGPRSSRVRIVPTTFERADLPPASFDFGFAATSLHWVPEGPALHKAARLLRPGGWWAAWWNVFGDPVRPIPFQKALEPIYQNLPRGPASRRRGRMPFALDRASRLAALQRSARFSRISARVFRRRVTLTTDRARSLYATYSEFSSLSPSRRERLLDELAGIARDRFAGRIALPILTPVYTARRR